MQRLLAITALTWKAAFRFRLFWVLTGLLLCSVVVLPLLIKDDGTARGFIQILLTYTLSVITALLGFSTLWLACGTLARDIEDCSMQMVVVKPIARWQIWLGKWLGILLLNASLLGVSGASIYSLLQWRTSRMEHALAQARQARDGKLAAHLEAQLGILRNEVFVARGSLKEPMPDIESDVNRQIEKLPNKGALSPEQLEETRVQLRERIKAVQQVVPPNHLRRWTLDLGLQRHLLRDQPLFLRVKFYAAQTNETGTYLGLWQVGPPESNRSRSLPQSLAANTFHELTIPPNLFDESGKLSLTGNYEIQRGSYQLSFSFIKRKFDIQKGSVITWTGDPTSANIDITALYKTLAPPIDLVEAQLAGLSVTELNTYKQRIPIQVLLKMKGELLKPQITFDILLPSDQVSRWPVVDAKLEQIRTDESELNKQVFALLLLNRFVGENPLQSDAGITSTSTLIRQSVSSILADQLNQLAGSLIKGVDVNFGINSADDYTTGTQATRTDLTVGVSKSLLNDRIKVSVGSNFELEGPANTNQSASTIAGDVAVDYQLSKDGRYILRAYRKNQYEGVIEGQVIETGLTFIFTLDYDHLRELFQKKNAETKQLKKEAKENKKNQAEQKIQ